MTREEIYEVVKQIFTEIIPEVFLDEISMDNNMKELGANSIDKADIIIESLEEIGVTIPMVKFGSTQTFRDVVEVIYSQINE